MDDLPYCVEHMKLLHFDNSLVDFLKKYVSLQKNSEDFGECLNSIFVDLFDEHANAGWCSSSHGDEYGCSSCALCHDFIYGRSVEYHEIHYHTCVTFLDTKLCLCDKHVSIDPNNDFRIINEEEFVKVLHHTNSGCDDDLLIKRLVIWYFHKKLEKKFPEQCWEIAEQIANMLKND